MPSTPTNPSIILLTSTLLSTNQRQSACMCAYQPNDHPTKVSLATYQLSSVSLYVYLPSYPTSCRLRQPCYLHLQHQLSSPIQTNMSTCLKASPPAICLSYINIQSVISLMYPSSLKALYLSFMILTFRGAEPSTAPHPARAQASEPMCS